MQYDALNRLIQKNYSDGRTPTASFNFDQTSAYGVTVANTTGRLSSESTASPNPTGAVFSYDQLGRVKINSQCTPQNCGANTVFPVIYSYDLLGDMLTSTNGVGVTLTYAVNLAPRLTTLTSSLSDSNHPGTLFSAAYYNAAGSMLSASLGNVIAETRTYDPRLRLASIADGSNYSLSISSSGGYAPNGDILAANDSANGNWIYSYDDFNRLSGSNQNSGQSVYSYVYDRFGNRWQQNGPHSMQLSFSGGNNRMDGYSYDAAGNLLSDGTHNYTYDAENRITQVDGGSTAAYVYDANGQRVQKTASSGSVSYLYDLAGHQITEINSSGGWNRGEVYASNRHVATYVNSTTYFIHPDWLGTERARADVSGALCETTTSLPFGDWQTSSGSCGDPSPMHFTGKERDSESGLDNFGARYDSSSMGRFMSPDAFYKDSHVGDPQSWNEYAYARNNPLRYVDPNGETATVSSNCTTDPQNHTTCNVNISATIVVYSANGANLSQDQLNAAASTIQSSIQNAWSSSFAQDGVTYNVSAQISVSVAGSETDAMKSGAQNVIGLSNGPANAAQNINSEVFTKSLGTAIFGGPDKGIWNYNTLGQDSAHEFTHLLGTFDKPGAVLSNTNILNDPSIPHTATSSDFRWGIREAINSVNSSRAMIGSCAPSCGLVPSQPRISTTETVGAPWRWWK